MVDGAVVEDGRAELERQVEVAAEPLDADRHRARPWDRDGVRVVCDPALLDEGGQDALDAAANGHGAVLAARRLGGGEGRPHGLDQQCRGEQDRTRWGRTVGANLAEGHRGFLDEGLLGAG